MFSCELLEGIVAVKFTVLDGTVDCVDGNVVGEDVLGAVETEAVLVTVVVAKLVTVVLARVVDVGAAATVSVTARLVLTAKFESPR